MFASHICDAGPISSARKLINRFRLPLRAYPTANRATAVPSRRIDSVLYSLSPVHRNTTLYSQGTLSPVSEGLAQRYVRLVGRLLNVVRQVASNASCTHPPLT